MGESISEYMKRRAREAGLFGREAEAAAHEAYRRAIRVGQDLKLSSPIEVMRHGAKFLQERAGRAGRAASNIVEQAGRQSGEVLNRASRNPQVRAAATTGARRLGNVAGVARGGIEAAQGLAEGAVFAGRLLDPFDPFRSPRGEAAISQLSRGVLNAGRKTADYVRGGFADPRSVVRDIRETGQQWRRDVDPSATPAAPTFTGELRRNFDIGQNQGELAFEAGSLVVGGPAAKAMRGLGRVSNVGNVKKYVAQGFSPEAAEHFAKPYPSRNMGHHFMGRSMGLPKSYSDSVFNVLKPDDISRGDFYELHYNVDPHFFGTKGFGRENWSGKQLGLERYGVAGRLWHGSPPPLKARVGGLGATAGTLMYAPESEETGR